MWIYVCWNAYTYLDIWVGRVKINIKNGNIWFILLNRFYQFYAFFACLLCLYSRHSLLYMLFNLNLSVHVCLSLHTTWHPTTRWGVSDSPKFACSDTEAWIEVEPSAEDQAYPRSRPSSPSSFGSWLFLLAREIPSQLMSIFWIVHVVNLFFVPNSDVMYL